MLNLNQQKELGVLVRANRVEENRLVRDHKESHKINLLRLRIIRKITDCSSRFSKWCTGCLGKL